MKPCNLLVTRAFDPPGRAADALPSVAMGDVRSDDRAGSDKRAGIVDTLTRYAWALTDRDWDTWVSCFTDDAHVDFTGSGDVAGTPADAATWIAKMMESFAIGVNAIDNISIDFDGDDTATSRTLFTMTLKVAGDTPTYMEARGCYRDRCRTNGGWRIAERVETVADLHG